MADFAGVGRALTITAYQMGHGLTLLAAHVGVVCIALLIGVGFG